MPRAAGPFLLAGILMLASSVRADDPPQLRLVVHDGNVSFQGDNLDVEQLQAKLAASGRQTDPLYFQVGANAKSVFISRVLRAVRAAGFTHVVILGPDGQIRGDVPERPVD